MFAQISGHKTVLKPERNSYEKWTEKLSNKETETVTDEASETETVTDEARKIERLEKDRGKVEKKKKTEKKDQKLQNTGLQHQPYTFSARKTDSENLEWGWFHSLIQNRA